MRTSLVSTLAVCGAVSVVAASCACSPEIEISGGPEERCAASDSDLVRAAEAGDVARVRQALRNGADPNDTDESGNSALACAGPPGHVEVVEVLLEAGADPETVARDGDTVAEDAVLFCRSSVLERLLDAGASAGGEVEGAPMVELALYTGDLDTLHVLLGHGADPNDILRHRTFSLFPPALRDDWPPSGCDFPRQQVADGLLALLDAGAEPNLVLERALWENQSSVVSPALTRGADPDREGVPLALAAAWGNAEATQLLLDAGADPDQGTFAPFDHPAADFCVVQVEDNAETMPFDETILWCDAIGHLRWVTGQSATDASGQFWSAPPLVEAAGSGDLATVQALLAAGADPNVVGELGFTPLHAAAAVGDLEIIDALVQAGAHRPESEAVPPSEVARLAAKPQAADLLTFLGS